MHACMHAAPSSLLSMDAIIIHHRRPTPEKEENGEEKQARGAWIAAACRGQNYRNICQ